MKQILLHILTVAILSTISVFISCEGEFVPAFEKADVEAYVPIYGETNETVEITGTHQIINPGKIVSYGDYILLEEIGNGKGYHIIDNSVTAQLKNIGFLNIPDGASLAIKEGVLYANSGSDLLIIQIATDTTLSVSKLKGVFENVKSSNLPPESGNYFVCVDAEKGDVVGWDFKTVYNPQCYH